MSKKDNVAVVPKYRFPEFLNCLDWKKEELNKLGKVISGLTYSPQDIREEGLLVLRSSNIKDNVIDLKDTVYVRSNIKGYTLTEEKDILICVRNGSKTLIGKNALVPKGMPLCTNGAFMIVFRANNPWFVFQLFQSKQFDKQVKADLGATINSINSKQLKKYIFAIPQERKEQQKIADCLSSIDDLIFSEEKKLSLLNDYKKGWMQKLFPAEGKTVPEWRFPEFKDGNNWKCVEIETVGKVITGKTPPTSNDSLWNGSIQFVTPTDIVGDKCQRLVQRTVVKTSKMKVLPKGTIMFTCIASIGKMAISVYPCVTNQQINSIITNKGYYNEFIYYSLFRNVNKIKSDLSNTTVPIINKTDFSKIKISVTLNEKEQEKIANFLSGIDELISSQKEKIEKLKQHKKALMQGLFPAAEEVCK